MTVTRFPPGAARQTAGCDLQAATIGKDGLDRYLVIPSKRVVVKGKHERPQDEHGFISRHAVRKYALHKRYDRKELVLALSLEVVIIMKIPKPSEEHNANAYYAD
ncbi:heat shock protein 23-like [Hermetia illucens]|uniref:heat shock protein 23-like n=1 Tax=Hermetia illucens TaxID=343691 RepID=UPI0018CC32E4|nr:heat shock protein 23-like [Hermetia illucens]